MRRWILPDFVEDVLPPEAERVELVRRALIDTCHACGYDLVQPPLVEYLDTLTAGAGEDLEPHTFKLVDQLSGRLLGIRADMTPQVARIDAHFFGESGINRLCYAGSVLHTTPTALNATREVLQGGAEVYGHAGIESDIEILGLLLDTLSACGVRELQLDVGHVAVFQALAELAGLTADTKQRVLQALLHKESEALNREMGVTDALRSLLTRYGNSSSVLANAADLALLSPKIAAALAQLQQVSDYANMRGVAMSIDLADLPSYQYHTGLVFAVYSLHNSAVLARGGRYAVAIDGSRSATGFSMDLRLVGGLIPAPNRNTPIFAPSSPDSACQAAINALRSQGERVIIDHQSSAASSARKLSLQHGSWLVT